MDGASPFYVSSNNEALATKSRAIKRIGPTGWYGVKFVTDNSNEIYDFVFKVTGSLLFEFDFSVTPEKTHKVQSQQ